MTHETYYRLVSDALAAESEEMFISAPGWADWMDEYGDDTDRLASDMRNIYQVSHMTMLDLLFASGLTKAAFSRRFLIPLRTVENWVSGIRPCPIYVRLMIADLLGLVAVERH